MPSFFKPGRKSLYLVLLLFFCLCLIAFREIDLVIHPRLWAEEGAVFYKFALNHSVSSTLFTPQVGYLTLFNGFVSWVQTRLFSPEYAAVVSTVLAGLIQILPVLLVLFSNTIYWNTFLKKTMFCLAIILLTPPELWLTSTNSHFIMGLTTFLIMIIPAEGLSKSVKWLFRGLLVVNNLTGPTSMLLTPVFIWRALKSGDKEKKIQALVQCIAACIQASAVFYCLLYQNNYHRLSVSGDGNPLNHFMIDHFTMNIKVIGIRDTFHVGIVMILLTILLLTLKSSGKEDPRFLIISFILVAVFSSLGSLGMQGSPRYGYVSTCILFCVWINETESLKPFKKLWRVMAWVILLFTLVFGVMYYKRGIKTVYSDQWPRWRNEVKQWRKNPAYKPHLHPLHDFWVLDLQKSKP